MSARLQEQGGQEEEPCPGLAGLPAHLKVLSRERDGVLSLQELALRLLHLLQEQPAGLSTGLPVVRALLG